MAHIIREISIKDTEALTTLLTKIYDESDYTLYNPGEFNPSVSSISNRLERVITSPRNTIYVAEEDDQLVGCIFVTTENTNVHNTKQSLHLVLLNFIKKGIGLALINAVEAWALNHNIKRLQASVVPENTHALMLLKGAGFNIEGELKNKLLINNQYFNKYIMAKLLL